MNGYKLQVVYSRWTLALILILMFHCMKLLAENEGSWQAEGLSILSDDRGVALNLDALSWQDKFTISKIRYHCPEQLSIYPLHRCKQAKLSLIYDEQAYQSTVNSQFNSQQNEWNISLKTYSGQLGGEINSNNKEGLIQFNDFDIKYILNQLLTKANESLIPTGTLNGEFKFDFEKFSVFTQLPIKFKEISYEYSDDVIVAELGGLIGFDADLTGTELKYTLSLDAGEMLLNEVYVDFSAYPVTVEGEVKWQDNGWYLVTAELINKQSLTMSAQVSINKLFEWQFPTVTALITDSHHFNQHILGSVLGIYGFGNSGMSGQFEVAMDSNEQLFDHWSVTFNDYYFLNERRRIAAESLTGRIDWQLSKNSEDSKLSWQKLQLAGLPIDSADIAFNISEDQFELLGEQQFPVLNGGIELEVLYLGDLFSDAVKMNLKANILPISLKMITESMGWPVMAGSISGDIPGMVKQGSVIEFLGALNLKVFEGTMRIENLSMERLFGVAPVIAADIGFEGFDLSLLTETFGFGLITGKLSGVFNQLRITNWHVDRMDAEVYTVKTKGIKQIISQKAIDNISSLGGIRGAISKTFLRFFDDFRYSQIKLSCKLHNSVCEIGGLKNQNNQFVIVEGGGIPKINIVGYVRSIDWEEFVSRLLNANYDN